MRIVDLNRFLEFRKKLDRRITLFFSAIIGIVFFVFIMFSGFFTGLIWGIVMFVLSFLIIYGIRVMTNNGVERKRSKAEATGTVLDVNFGGEFGLLVINEDKIEYVSLQKFGLNKVPEIEINEDLFIGIGKFKYGIFQKLKYRDDIRCQITLNAMPRGIHYIFTFYDIEGSFEKVTQLLDEINQFNLEKHQ